MNRDIRDRIELMNYIEMRYIPDIDRYSRMLASMGDVFKPDVHGLYHPRTGDCIVNFERPGYFIDPQAKSYRKRRVDILTYADFDNAVGDIYDYDGRLVMAARNVKRVELLDERPLIYKARDAALALIDDNLDVEFDHYMSSREIPKLCDVMYDEDEITSKRCRTILSEVRREIDRDILNRLQEYRWNEVHLHRDSSTVIIDVKMDIRIKQYYENLFSETDRSDADGDITRAVSGVSRRRR